MRNNSFFKNILFVCLVALFASCDKDFNEIGSDIIGDNHFELSSDLTKTITATNYNFGPIQSNNLSINALGIYKNPVFGTTTASFVTQLEFPAAGLNPTIDADLVPEIESVLLTVPYFTKNKITATDGSSTYDLDAIYGASASQIKLSVYENGYYLRDLDPVSGFQSDQKYYSDQNEIFDFVRGTTLLNNSTTPSQNSQFVFSPEEYTDITTTPTTRTAPGMRLSLDKDFFKTKIMDAPTGKLVNNNVFKEYFRGLYFKVENSAGSDAGQLAMLNFKLGKVTIKYKEYKTKPVSGDPLPEKVDKEIVLNLTGNTVNLLENSNPAALSSDKLFLKGGEGSMAVIDLFGPDADNNGVADELEQLRNEKWLVNEANLTFYIDKTEMDKTDTGFITDRAPEPTRIYLYDLNNKRPLVDYYIDNSVSSNPKLSKYIHGGIIENETDGDKRGKRYKIRLTNHIRNLIKHSDSTNVKLGLVVTDNIATITSAKLKTPFSSGVFSVDRAPLSTVVSPLGTVLYGSESGVPSDKRLKLEIYYTKPN